MQLRDESEGLNNMSYISILLSLVSTLFPTLLKTNLQSLAVARLLPYLVSFIHNSKFAESNSRKISIAKSSVNQRILTSKCKHFPEYRARVEIRFIETAS